ncbi:Uncharacterised protein [Bordetella bronchiseptica]|uniref:hypothetical protein n=1 Tax=Bordetella bronchiseptica TaxID=518 RepID=UPI000E1371DB|nr:hypothetical protein [Bordetella bronchiseptica]SUW10772.1 Uncharacterised protein [Bordetella bronchiseptica]
MPYDPMNQVHPGPTEGIDRIPDDATQARTGNTEREQEAWFVGIQEGQRRTEHNAAVRSAWMPIESAPKDGTEIWAYNGEQARMCWIEGEGYALWAWADELLSDADPNPDQPTHWQPLPAAPSPAPSAPGDAQGGVTVLPDGSAFALASFPLPATHWLYAEREYAPGAEEPKELPDPILTHAQRDAVVAAIRYAVRGATMCGKEQDLDPDALVQNAVYALCGPYGFAAPAAGDARDALRELVECDNLKKRIASMQVCALETDDDVQELDAMMSDLARRQPAAWDAARAALAAQQHKGDE